MLKINMNNKTRDYNLCPLSLFSPHFMGKFLITLSRLSNIFMILSFGNKLKLHSGQMEKMEIQNYSGKSCYPRYQLRQY